VNVGAFSDGAQLPPVQKTKLVFNVKNSAVKTVSSSKPDNAPKEQQICLDKQGDDVFFPETAIAVIDTATPADASRNYANITSADETRICAAVHAAAYDDFTGGYTQAHISVQFATTAPIN
jgi:hypothetical protein